MLTGSSKNTRLTLLEVIRLEPISTKNSVVRVIDHIQSFRSHPTKMKTGASGAGFVCIPRVLDRKMAEGYCLYGGGFETYDLECI